MTDGDALLRAVCENPAEDTPRLAYADWLDENDDEPRAELIRLQIALATMPDGGKKQKAQARQKKLLQDHAEEWTEPLAEFASGHFGEPFEFRRGFVEAIGVDEETFVEQGDELFELAPVREVWFGELEEFGDMAKCKHLLRLDALDLTGSGLSHYFDPAPLLKSRYLANLTTLRLGGHDDNGHLDMQGVKALLASKYLGKVETLDLSGNWLNQENPATFARFLTAKNLPSLRSLDLARVEILDAGAVALAATPWIAKLKVLNLRRNMIGEVGARSLLDSKLLRDIELLDLRDNLGSASDESVPIGPATKQALAKRFGSRVLL